MNPLLEETKKNLESNGFQAYVCDTPEEAKEIFLASILPAMRVRSVSYGDSITLHETCILDELRKIRGVEFIETFDQTISREERNELRRKALSVDLFLSGSNAITRKGQIINLDMVGNRINGIVFGPKEVVLAAGVNKIVKDVEEGMKRIKEICAPRNAKRHPHFNLPCAKTGRCTECGSDNRICNVWSIIEKCFPKKRIKVILIDKELGI